MQQIHPYLHNIALLKIQTYKSVKVEKEADTDEPECDILPLTPKPSNSLSTGTWDLNL